MSSTQPPFADPPRPQAVVLDTRLVETRGRTKVSAATPTDTAPSFGVDDVYYALFRHKWKIIICGLLGLIAASAYYYTRKPSYFSSAKLYVRYVVMEGKTARSGADDTITKSPDRGGETIMTAEQAIISSLDLARKTAEAVGPEKILAKMDDGGLSSLVGRSSTKTGAGNDLNAAAAAIRDGLNVTGFASIIGLTFTHSDAEVVQLVMRETITQYLKMHVEIHRSAGMVGDFLAQETDQLRSRLSQTEDELRKARAKAGVISVEDSKKSYATQIDALRQQIFAAQAEQAQRASMLKQLSQKPSAPPKPTIGTNPESAPEEAEAEVPTTVIDAYRSILSRLEFLRRREMELLLTFTAENSRVQDSKSQVAELERRKLELEEQNPRLARAPTTKSAASPGSSAPTGAGDRAYTLEVEAAQLNALDVRIKTLTSQMEILRKEAVGLDQLEGNILELTRKRELEEANYRRYSSSLEQSRINEALGSGKVSNISIIQTPTPASIIPGKAEKTAGTIAAGGLGLGLAWAFLIELLLDRSVRRPGEIERLLKIPLFLSIPKHQPKPPRRRRRFLRRAAEKSKALQPVEPDAVLVLPGETAADSTATHLNPYFETLRDLLSVYFESRNLTHKPKLVAMTGIGPHSGVTTMAAGLARCLSETGEGNVLLVDLTPGQGSAQYFHAGKTGCGLEELLETRSNAQVQDKLFVASDGSRGDKLSRILPQRFAKLLPQLKSSDFDYIIFDMPPVSQISITPRLAGFMDMVLLVVESEKNSREGVQRATTLLSESNAHVGAVLNKTKTYVPSWLHQELTV